MDQKVVPTVSQSSRRYTVPLENVPDRFVVPQELQARFSYDPAQKQLAFKGWMCKATYDRLRNISSDFAYQRALERLFQMAVPEEETPSPKRYGLLVAASRWQWAWPSSAR